jgi:hypothetical protein
MKIKTTNKLFYNKYPYKLECFIRGASYVTRNGPKEALEICNSDREFYYGWRGNPTINKVELAIFIKAARRYITKEKQLDIKIRTEGGHFNVFCKDVALFEKIKKSLEPWAKFVTEPASDKILSFMLNNGPRKVVVKQLPLNLYKYKITMRSTVPAEVKENFVKWTNKYAEDTFRISSTTKKWLGNAGGYKQDPFFYVQDNSALTITSLYLGSHIRKIEEFVIADSIKEA